MLCWWTTETQIPPMRMQEKWWMWVMAIVKRPRPQQKAKRRVAQTLPKARTRSWATQFLRSMTHCLEGCQPLWLQSSGKSCEMRWRRRCQRKSDFVAIKVCSLFPDEIIQTLFISIDEILDIGLLKLLWVKWRWWNLKIQCIWAGTMVTVGPQHCHWTFH